MIDQRNVRMHDEERIYVRFGKMWLLRPRCQERHDGGQCGLQGGHQGPHEWVK